MELIRTCVALRSATDAWRASDLDVGLVPTMGALHEGHDALIERARRDRDRVVVSIFVNPSQFVRGEDFDRYPRDEAADLARAEAHGADVVWAPPVDEMYPPGAALPEPDPGRIGTAFEGAERPGHFAGVLKAVHRLLDVVGPCAAYFGEKDAQQLAIVRRLVADFAVPATIVAVQTVREPDGLALSSRNRHLTPDERRLAPALYQALCEADRLIMSGVRDVDAITNAAVTHVLSHPSLRLEYFEIVEPEDMQPVTSVTAPVRVAGSLWVGSTRLIDNLLSVPFGLRVP